MSIYSRIVNNILSREIIRWMSRYQLPMVVDDINRLHEWQVRNYLWDKILHCREIGVSEKRMCDEEVVVSLTSFGGRIHDVCLAIESIMQQTVKPNRIVLWLAEDEFKGKSLPVALQMQQERGLEIAYCEDIKSYKKLVPSLKLFPDACIITIDDDAAYCPDIVEKLIDSHKDKPSDICAMRMHVMVLDDKDKLKPYEEWDMCVKECPKNNNLAFFTNGGGVLYPPHRLSDEVFNKDVFLDICETADDVWFNAMRLLSGIQVVKVFSQDQDGGYFMLASSKLDPLEKKNWEGGGNDRAIYNVFERYGLFEKLKIRNI